MNHIVITFTQWSYIMLLSDYLFFLCAFRWHELRGAAHPGDETVCAGCVGRSKPEVACWQSDSPLPEWEGKPFSCAAQLYTKHHHNVGKQQIYECCFPSMWDSAVFSECWLQVWAPPSCETGVVTTRSWSQASIWGKIQLSQNLHCDWVPAFRLILVVLGWVFKF